MSESIVQCRPRPRNRLSVTLSGGRSFIIPESEGHGYRTGMLLSGDEVAKLDRTAQYLRGKEKALRLLAIRSRTRQEIETALARLALDAAVSSGIVQDLCDQGLIDDLRFTREYVRAKTEFKRLGPHRLRAELIRLGVRRGFIDRVLDEAFQDETQEALAWKAARKKIGTATLDERLVKRVSDHLKRKGFDFEVVNRVTFQLLANAGSENIPDDTMD